MNIKVCGITSLKQLEQLDGLDIDYAGLIFYEASPRYMRGKIDPKKLIAADLDIRKVGVFVNSSMDEILDTVEEYELDAVQLHGNESVDFCIDLAEETEVIKAFRIGAKNEDEIDELVAPYDDACDYFLFDAAPADGTFGGSGKRFDWEKLEAARIEKPFFLSGGIGPDDAEKLKAFKHPDFYCADVNSKFESSPGVKDMAKVLKFLKELKN